MSDDLQTIQRAIALVLERAAAATEANPGPWAVRAEPGDRDAKVRDASGEVISYAETGHNASMDRPTAEHVASWSPDVATLIADWLTTAGADLWAHGPLCCEDGCDACDDNMWAPHVRRALAFSRAYVAQG